MKDLFLRVYIAWKLVPLLLRGTVIFCFGFGFLSVIAALIPSVRIIVDDQEVSHSQYFRSAVGIGLTILGSIMVAVGSGILLRKTWTRPAILLLLPFAYFLHAALGLSDWRSLGPGILWSIILFIAPMAGYLYFKTSVRSYFHSEQGRRFFS